MLFIPPPPLGFPSFQLVQSLAKGILENLNKMEAELRQNTGMSLVIKQFEKPTQDDTLTPAKKPSTNGACISCKSKKVKCDGKQAECKHHQRSRVTVATSPMVRFDNDKKSPSMTPSSLEGVSNFQDMVLQHTRPRPAINQYGHFMGETSYYCSARPFSTLYTSSSSSASSASSSSSTAYSTYSASSPSAYSLSSVEQSTHPPEPYSNMAATPPQLTKEDQLHLIDVYYTHIHPQLPLINKQDLLMELERCNQGEPSFLSPLFFYALFARSAPFSHEPRRFQSSSGQSMEDVATQCLQYANRLRDAYLHQPRTSTVMALLFMAVHLEQSKQPKDFSRVWIWTGEAFRMILDLGLHRWNSFNDSSSHSDSFSSHSSSTSSSSSISPATANYCMSPGSTTACPTMTSPISMEGTECKTKENNVFHQFGIRTFWAAFVIDRSMSLICGRPFTLEEKDIDVPLPKYIEQDDNETTSWMPAFHDLIDISKIMGRIAKFNYSPHSTQRGPIRHQDAMLSTLDSWITSLLKEPPSYETTTTLLTQQRHLNTIRLLELYTLLILLHRPYVHEQPRTKTASNGSSSPAKPSSDICSHTAMIITHLVSDLSSDDLIYLSKSSSIVTYALILALRIHLVNASASHDQKAVAFGEINFEQTLDQLRMIPTAAGSATMLSESIEHLESQYKQRQSSIVSGFTRSYGKLPISATATAANSTHPSLDMQLLQPSGQGEGSASCLDSDHGMTKRPYSMECDYSSSTINHAPVSVINNTGPNAPSNCSTTKPMQKLKIIEVHPSKGKSKKHKAIPSASNAHDITSSSSINKNTNSNTTPLQNVIHRSGNEGSIRNYQSSPTPSIPSPSLVNQKSTVPATDYTAVTLQTMPGISVRSGNTGTPVMSDISPQQQHKHQHQHHNLYQHTFEEQLPQQSYNPQRHHHSPFHIQESQDMSHAFGNMPPSHTPDEPNYASGRSAEMEYSMNSLFTLGDGLNGHPSSSSSSSSTCATTPSLLYDQFFATTPRQHMMNAMTASASASYCNTSISGNQGVATENGTCISGDNTAEAITSSLQLPYSTYVDANETIFSSDHSSMTTSTAFISPQYLPSR